MGFELRAAPVDEPNSPLVVNLFWNDLRSLHLGLSGDDANSPKRREELLVKFIEASRRVIFLQKVGGRAEVELSYNSNNLLGLYCTPEAEQDERVRPEFLIAEDGEYERGYANYVRRATLRHLEPARLFGRPRAGLEQVVKVETRHLDSQLRYLLDHGYIELRKSETDEGDQLGITDAGSRYLETLGT
jgi:hypothetical protein